MLQCVIYEIILTRKIVLPNGKIIESGFTSYEPIDASWDELDVMHWANFKFGDLIDTGWACNLERVDHGSH
jgi:hypothetical protein